MSRVSFDKSIQHTKYNAKNESGFIKAWDNDYMKNMISQQGTYPNKYTREYVQQLIDGQKIRQLMPLQVQAIQGRVL